MRISTIKNNFFWLNIGWVVMKSHMSRMTYKGHKLMTTVVIFITQMMNCFTFFKISTKRFFNNQDVLKYVSFTKNRPWMIWRINQNVARLKRNFTAIPMAAFFFQFTCVNFRHMFSKSRIIPCVPQFLFRLRGVFFASTIKIFTFIRTVFFANFYMTKESFKKPFTVNTFNFYHRSILMY